MDVIKPHQLRASRLLAEKERTRCTAGAFIARSHVGFYTDPPHTGRKFALCALIANSAPVNRVSLPTNLPTKWSQFRNGTIESDAGIVAYATYDKVWPQTIVVTPRRTLPRWLEVLALFALEAVVLSDVSGVRAAVARGFDTRARVILLSNSRISTKGPSASGARSLLELFSRLSEGHCFRRVIIEANGLSDLPVGAPMIDAAFTWFVTRGTRTKSVKLPESERTLYRAAWVDPLAAQYTVEIPMDEISRSLGLGRIVECVHEAAKTPDVLLSRLPTDPARAMCALMGSAETEYWDAVKRLAVLEKKKPGAGCEKPAALMRIKDLRAADFNAQQLEAEHHAARERLEAAAIKRANTFARIQEHLREPECPITCETLDDLPFAAVMPCCGVVLSFQAARMIAKESAFPCAYCRSKVRVCDLVVLSEHITRADLQAVPLEALTPALCKALRDDARFGILARVFRRESCGMRTRVLRAGDNLGIAAEPCILAIYPASEHAKLGRYLSGQGIRFLYVPTTKKEFRNLDVDKTGGVVLIAEHRDDLNLIPVGITDIVCSGLYAVREFIYSRGADLYVHRR